MKARIFVLLIAMAFGAPPALALDKRFGEPLVLEKSLPGTDAPLAIAKSFVGLGAAPGMPHAFTVSAIDAPAPILILGGESSAAIGMAKRIGDVTAPKYQSMEAKAEATARWAWNPFRVAGPTFT